MKSKKLASILLAAVALLLLAAWIRSGNAVAGISSALILMYLTGLLYWAASVLSWILSLPLLFYSLAVQLPVLSTLDAMITPSLARIIVPLLVPLQLFFYKIGPLKWITDRARKVRSVKMARCVKCRRFIPSDGALCPYCGFKVRRKSKRKDVPNKKRGS
jgi:hypothetical protein